MVEDGSVAHLVSIGAAAKRGVEIDDAGERGDPTQCILQGRLGSALHRLNPDLPHETIEEMLRVLARPPHPTLIQNNRWFHTLLTDGVEVEYRDAKSGETRGGRARLVDFENPVANELLVVRQLSIASPTGKIIRPDLTVYLSGVFESVGSVDQKLDFTFLRVTFPGVKAGYIYPVMMGGGIGSKSR